MRFYRTLPGGSSLEITSFFMNRSLTSRMLMLGLPLLALVLLLIFLATGSSIETIVNRAIARNAQLQAQAMGLALERILAETRNHLLILAAGSMEPREMVHRLQFRAKAEGLHYREVAFMGLTPESRYLLLNDGGGVITVPQHQALESPTGPFHSMGGDQRPGLVTMGQPLEVTYSMVPVNTALQSFSLYVLRFFTSVYDAEGLFKGCLMLSLDLRELRDVMSVYSAPDAPIAADGRDSLVRSLFFDREGWMLFQSETPDSGLAQKKLGTDLVRAGFMGDFARPGFNMAFRPSPDHLNYWSMVADVQNGRSGQLPMYESGSVWSNGQLRVERVSYVPIAFRQNSQSQPVVLGGLAVLDTSFTTTRTGMQIMGIYVCAFVGGMLLLAISLWWLARQMGRSLNMVTAELRRSSAENTADNLVLPRMPVELERLRTGVDDLLGRLRDARARRRTDEAEEDAQWRREPVTDLPHPEDLPANGLVGSSPAMLSLFDQVRKASQVMADVLVVGETGTGKELVSEAIHRLSARGAAPFITINCGALDENLLMDTLFGHVKGAFTEARQPRKGAFLAAQGGTLMLDEVGTAAPKVQQALLRALSTRRIRPLGSDQDVPFDTRIIAATNSSLLEDAREGSFREDLYYRLAVITIHTPPLRERKDDIPALTMHFLDAACKSRGHGVNGEAGPRTLPQISRGALRKLVTYAWPGNVRELKNTLTRALTFCDGHILYAENIQLGPADMPQDAGNTPSAQESSQESSRNSSQNSGQNAAQPSAPESAQPPDPSPGPSPDQPSEPRSGAQPHMPGPAPGASAAAPPAPPPGLPPLADSAAQTPLADARDSGMTPPRRPAAPASPSAGNRNPADKLNRRLADVWPLLEARDGVSRQEYQELAGGDISMRTAQYDLQELVRLGLVRKEGRGPALRYMVARRLPPDDA